MCTENVTVHVATRLLRMEYVHAFLFNEYNMNIPISDQLLSMFLRFYLTDKPEIRDAIAQLLRRTFDYTGWLFIGIEAFKLFHKLYKTLKYL